MNSRLNFLRGITSWAQSGDRPFRSPVWPRASLSDGFWDSTL